MSLDEWCRNGWLKKHQTSPQEIADLLHVADRDLKDCTSAGLSADWKLSIAYNAALQSATAALAAAGFRVARGESAHFRVIQSLEHTVNADVDLVAQLDAYRKKRNELGYERAGVVSDREAQEMQALARSLRGQVEAWLRGEHAELM